MIERLARLFTGPFDVWGNSITNGAWGPVESFAKLGDVKGLMENQSGTQRNIAERETQTASFVFYCLAADWNALGTATTHEIRKGGIIYDVTNAEDVQGRGRVMQIDCIARR
jgi:hypothetical protein